MSSLNTTNYKDFQFSIYIRCGKNFENKKWIEFNSPYVEVSVGEESKKSSKASGLKDCCWDETLKFGLKDKNNLPLFIKFVVKDDRTLFPTAELGEYTFDLDKEKLLNYLNQKEMTPFLSLYDGVLNLKNSTQGTLDVKILFECTDINWLESQNKSILSNNLDTNNNLSSNVSNVKSDNFIAADSTITSNAQQVQYEEVNKSEYQKVPDIALQRHDIEVDKTLEENKFEKLDQNEVHVLPTIHVKEKPNIIEKEVEYIKPVEIKQTIVHKEKPIIVEQPIIKEKHEHYREAPDYVRNNETVVTEKVHEQHVGNLDQEQLLNLRQQRLEEFNDTTPIVQYEKQHIQLDTDVREKPTEIREKEVIYQQPVEIEKTNIETIKPKVREEVTVEKEHVYQKVAPEVYTQNVQHVEEGDEFYSKETASNLQVIKDSKASVTTNVNQQSQVM